MGDGANSSSTGKLPDNPAAWIRNTVQDFIRNSAENRLGGAFDEVIFDRPLVGFSNGSDPLYQEFVSHIGDFYFTPFALFQKTYPGETLVKAEDLTVISWILPSTDHTREEQAAEARYPSERWCRVRHFGEMLNESLRRFLVAELSEKGIPAVAPMLSEFWKRSEEGPYAPCSNWSERHAAYAAGLGTFGLCDGLITPVGKAMRSGSVIARISIPPSRRPYTDHHAYCLFYSHGTCGDCMARCPVGAITPSGHDKKKCMQYTEKVMNQYIKRAYDIDTYSCGLCQAGVPCTEGIPATPGKKPNHV